MTDEHDEKSSGSRELGRAGWLIQSAAILGVALVGIAIWELIVWFFELKRALLPTPRAVVAAAIRVREDLFSATLVTFAAAVAGLSVAVVIGSIIGILFSLSRLVRLAFFPYVVFLQTVPIVAIAPILVVWSGYQFRTVLMVTVIVCLFPIVNSVTSGLLSVERQLSDLFQLYGASKAKRLWWLQIPAAVPYLMLGTKTSSGLAVIGAIIAEFFVRSGSAQDGLGTLMIRWEAQTKTDALFAALIASTLVGLALFGLVQLISVTIVKRYGRNVA